MSTATVSRVINSVGYISEATKKKVQDAVLFLNYIPNKMVRLLSTNKSNVIAVLVEDLSNPYYMTLIDAMVERANQENHIVSIFAIKNRDVRLVLRGFAFNMVCGIVNLAMFTCEFSNYDVFSNAGNKTNKLHRRQLGVCGGLRYRNRRSDAIPARQRFSERGFYKLLGRMADFCGEGVFMSMYIGEFRIAELVSPETPQSL